MRVSRADLAPMIFARAKKQLLADLNPDGQFIDVVYRYR